MEHEVRTGETAGFHTGVVTPASTAAQLPSAPEKTPARQALMFDAGVVRQTARRREKNVGRHLKKRPAGHADRAGPRSARTDVTAADTGKTHDELRPRISL